MWTVKKAAEKLSNARSSRTSSERGGERPRRAKKTESMDGVQARHRDRGTLHLLGDSLVDFPLP